MKINPCSTGSPQTLTLKQSVLSLFPVAIFTNADLSPLTKREREIVRLLIHRKNRKEIGDDLGISVWTVDFHLRNARRKRSVSTTADLLVFFA